MTIDQTRMTKRQVNLHSVFWFRHSFAILVLSFWFLNVAGCERSTAELVLYTSVDQPTAKVIIDSFTAETGIKVRLVTDTEASKSVGLAERLRAERANPQCDVWWGNEPFHTIALAEEGLLQPYESPIARDVAPMYADPQHRWAGCGLRARVIASRDPSIKSIASLTDPSLKGKIAMARPTAGTTGGHVAALFVLWGDERATQFFRDLRANDVKVLGGNGPVAESVGRGQIAAGLTDNDDCSSVLREGGKLEVILPDQDGQGTLMVPTTIGLVMGTKRGNDARKLIDYLLTARTEQALIDANFAGWSVRKSSAVKAMQLDYAAAAKALPNAVRKVTAILEGRE